MIVDVADAQAVCDAVERVVAEHGGLYLLAHCAGVQSYGTAVSTTPEEWALTLAVDLDSAFYLTRRHCSASTQARRRRPGLHRLDPVVCGESQLCSVCQGQACPAKPFSLHRCRLRR